MRIQNDYCRRKEDHIIKSLQPTVRCIWEAMFSLMSCLVFMMHGQDQEDEITAPSHSLVKV